jgi:hypothetical protein
VAVSGRIDGLNRERAKEEELRLRSGLLLGLAVVLAVSMFVVVGCGGSDEDAKANLSTALDKVEASIAKFQSSMGATSTVDDVKNALGTVKPDWEAVVTAAKDVEGADVAAAEKAWTDVDTAIGSIPEGATILEAAALIMTPVTALLKVEQQLRALVPKEG